MPLPLLPLRLQLLMPLSPLLKLHASPLLL
jgi:hypothetical protein